MPLNYWSILTFAIFVERNMAKVRKYSSLYSWLAIKQDKRLLFKSQKKQGKIYYNFGDEDVNKKEIMYLQIVKIQ